MIGKVKIIKPGFFSTIQDEGRFGFAKFGVPRSGAMDQTSFNFANSLLGNNKNDTCIEWAFQPPVLQFSEPTSISVTGAETDCFLNGESIKMYHQIKVEKGGVLTMNFCKTNVYGYVGIKDGFQTPKVLSSRSFYKEITPQFLLKENDKIEYKSSQSFYDQFSNLSVPSFINDENELLVFKGPEFDQLSEKQKLALFTSRYTVSNMANRMAIQLEEGLPNDIQPILTSPVLPGTVQLTPSGNIIVLMRDCQTTGGYPRILQLSEKSIDHIAQKRANGQFSFQLIV